MSAERALLDRPFSISVVRSRGEVAVVPVGGVDLASAEILRHQVAKVQAGGAAQIVLDLTDVHFIDSTGLRMLLNIRNDAKRNHQTLTLVASAPTARRIFKITGTRGLFDWRADSTSPVKERADPRHELPTAHDVAISRFRFSLNDESPEML
jgi:anti-anti-sigma factor